MLPPWPTGSAGWPAWRPRRAGGSAPPGGSGCSTASPWTGRRNAWARSSPAAGRPEPVFRARWAALPEGLRATILYAGATGWTKGIGLLLLPLITGLLPAAEFGRLELLSSAAEIAAVLAGAGLVDTLYRFASLPGAEGRLGAARVTGLAVIVTLIGLVGAFAAAPLGARLPLPALPIEVILLGISVALEAAIGVPLAWLRMQNRAAAYAFVVILR